MLYVHACCTFIPFYLIVFSSRLIPVFHFEYYDHPDCLDLTLNVFFVICRLRKIRFLFKKSNLLSSINRLVVKCRRIH
jgi:hypothetical protein